MEHLRADELSVYDVASEGVGRAVCLSCSRASAGELGSCHVSL